jgi:hypothetical protein
MSAVDPATPHRSRLARMWGFVVELWDVLRRPSSVFGLGVLVFAGFVAGVVFWGGFNTALEVTNTEKFCTGCHEMRDNVFAELKPTIHFSNRSGVRASCPDCHVPHNWTDKIARAPRVYGCPRLYRERRQSCLSSRCRMKAREALFLYRVLFFAERIFLIELFTS